MPKPIHPLNLDIDDVSRFWLNVTKTDTCWVWGGGAFKVKGSVMNPGRFSWMVHKLQDPEDLQVMRSCNNLNCIRPDHLMLGDRSDTSQYSSQFQRGKKRNHKVRTNSASGYTGVAFDRRDNVYQAQVHVDARNRVSLGRYESPEIAASVVNDYIIAKGLTIPLNVIDPAKLAFAKAVALGRQRAQTIKQVRRVQPIKNHASGPEDKIQTACFKMFDVRGWLVKRITGNMYQSGLPDCWIAKKRYGQRWVEFKNPESFSFTPAQQEFFPMMLLQGVGIWILTAADEENYERLFKPSNLWQYMLGINPEALR